MTDIRVLVNIDAHIAIAATLGAVLLCDSPMYRHLFVRLVFLAMLFGALALLEAFA